MFLSWSKKNARFHYEMRQAPSSHINPDLAEDALELSILSCRDVPLPSGYEMHHASIFAKYIFPYPNDNPQSGKTKIINGNTSPGKNVFCSLKKYEFSSPREDLSRAVGSEEIFELRSTSTPFRVEFRQPYYCRSHFATYFIYFILRPTMGTAQVWNS